MNYADAKMRPYYIIVIGDQKNINRIKSNQKINISLIQKMNISTH